MRCEVCRETEKLTVCGYLDEPTVYFCWEHYVEHVREAHNGEPLPGCKAIPPSEEERLER